jgi:hypothetical protein
MPGAALAGAPAAVDRTDEAAQSNTADDEAEPGTAEAEHAGATAFQAAEAGDLEAGDREAGDTGRAVDAAEAGEPGEAVPAADTAGSSAAGTAGGASAARTGIARAGDDAVGAAAGTPETDRARQPDHTTEADGTGDAGGAGEDSSGEDSSGAADGAEADGTGDTGRAAVAQSGGGSEGTDAEENTGQVADDAAGAASLHDEVTIVPGVARYHRRGCILIRFLSDGDLETMTRREAEATGSVPCKACQPDQPDPSA